MTQHPNRTLEEAESWRDELRARFESYAGGDRPPSPPARLILQLWDAEAEVRRLRGGGS